jgi:hypothetical protein
MSPTTLSMKELSFASSNPGVIADVAMETPPKI